VSQDANNEQIGLQLALFSCAMKSFLRNLLQKPGRGTAFSGAGSDLTDGNGEENQSPSGLGGADDASQPRSVETSEEQAEVIVLEFRDFHRAIPVHCLKDDDDALSQTLQFPIADVAACVKSGRSTIPLSEIIRRAPNAFLPEAVLESDYQIRFPWQKVLKLINESAAATQGDEKETLAGKMVRARESEKVSPPPPRQFARFAPPPPPVTVRPSGDRPVTWLSRVKASSDQVGETPSRVDSGAAESEAIRLAGSQDSDPPKAPVSAAELELLLAAIPSAPATLPTASMPPVEPVGGLIAASSSSPLLHEEIARLLAAHDRERQKWVADKERELAQLALQRAEEKEAQQAAFERRLEELKSGHDEAGKAGTLDSGRELESALEELQKQHEAELEMRERWMSQLEADVETYRARIKAVLAERDRAIIERDELASKTKA
jgi:hypothetical protein